MSEEVDVCIVGSGAGGAPIALELARAGAKVVVLEKGPAYETAQFVHDELKIVRRDFFVPFVADEPHLVRSDAAHPYQASTFGWISCCVGGGTVHWAGYAFRHSADDLRQATVTGGIAGASIADWPITYDELEPWYARAEKEIGVSGVADATPHEPRRSTPYPLPPMRAHPLSKRVDAAATALERHAYPIPRALLSQPYQGRAACVYCDFCGSYGCEVAAKGSTADALLPRAVATGNCEVRPHSMATEVRSDASGRARSVVYIGNDGREHEQRARIVVVSCSAIESARLLLNSRSSAFPDGLANSSGLVGKNLMLLTSGGASGEFRFGGASGVEDLASREPFIGRAIRDHYGDSGLMVFGFASMSPIKRAESLSVGPQGETLWGRALKERLKTWYREGRHVEVETFAECLPMEMNRVEVNADVKDRFGLPVASVTFTHHVEDARRSQRIGERAVEVLQAMRADEVRGPSYGNTFDVLQCGTCRFGDDPRTSVLDRDCRAHDAPNLYVVDGSFMPTSGAVPPTMTIFANAFRVAQTIARSFRRRDVR